MATKPVKKAEKAEEESAVTSKSILNTLLKDHKSEHFAYVRPKHRLISTGSLILDSLIKVRSGGVVRIVGKGAELGKTRQMHVFAQNYMRVMENSKTIYFKAEARNTPEMQASSGLKWVFTPEEWEYGTVFEYPVNTFEVMAETLETLLPPMHAAGENLCVELDSMDGLMLRSDREKSVWGEKADNVKVAGVPLLTKLLFRRLGLPIVHYDVLFLATGQYSADIKLDPYAPHVIRQASSAGGNAIAHQADYVLEYQTRNQGDLILEDPKAKPDWRENKTLGVYATVDIRKSGTDVSGAKPKIPIRKGRVGCAIWVEREIVDMLISWELLAKEKGKEGSSWLHFSPDLLAKIKEATGVELTPKVNGENQAYKLLEDTPAVIPFLFDYFRKLTGGIESA